jgi:hypothetical protein
MGKPVSEVPGPFDDFVGKTFAIKGGTALPIWSSIRSIAILAP